MIKDSGERTAFSTGAVRDMSEGKGRFDLMPMDVLADYLDRADDFIESAFFKCIDEFQKHGLIRFLYDAIIIENPYESGEEMLLELSKHFEEGAQKYGEHNWEQGIFVHSYINSAIRHYLKFKAGWKDEPHDRAFIWNLLCCAWTMEHHPEMDDYTERWKQDGTDV